MELTIQGPFRVLNNDRKCKSEYRDSELRFVDPQNGAMTLPIEVRTRGKTRRRKDYCDFPPLRLRFDKELTEGTWFQNQKTLKLVTHCQDRKTYDQYVLLEYLAYRIYNLLTDHSQRVRLARVTYLENDRVLATRFGIFLEDWRKVASRNGVEAAKVDGGVNIKMLSAPDVNRVAVFQYMIGNEDWSALWPEPDEDCCHNTKPLTLTDGFVIPLPYDFDFAGIVNTPYANAKPPNTSVRRRRYRGLCHTQTDLSETLPLFHERREAIYDLFRNQAGLTKGKISRTLKYLDKFYDVISDPRQVERRLIRRCKED
jgi:hypothetical protein